MGRLPKNNLVSYDRFAHTFAQSRAWMHWDEIDELLRFFIKASCTKKNWSILDVGCGTGRLKDHIAASFAIEFQSHMAHYIGVDLSNQLLKRASKKESGIFLSQKFQHGDMRKIETIFTWQKFDAIFFIASFHHLETLEARINVLKQAQSLLTEDGCILMTNWHLLSEMNASRYSHACTTKYADGSADFQIKIGKHLRYYHAFSREEFEHLTGETGLKIIREVWWERNSVIILR